MSGQYPVTATVTPIFPSAQPTPQTVKNIGAVTVFLGTSSSLSASSGYALGPGSALSWEAGKPLFAVTAAGSSILSILDNGGSLFDASAVAAQISVAGVPSIDVPTILYDDTQTNSSHISPSIDISKYQSIAVFIFEKQTSGPDPAQPGINSGLLRDVFMSMSSQTLNPLGPPFKEYVGGYVGGGSQGLSGNSPQFTGVFPALGDSLTVTVNGNDAGISGTLTSRVVVLGSYRAVPRGQFSTDSTYETHDGFLSGFAARGTLRWVTGSLTAGQNITSLPPTISGLGQIVFYVGSAVAAPGVVLIVQAMDSGAVIASHLATDTTPAMVIQQVNIPAEPLSLIVHNLTSATITATIYVSFLYDLG